MASAQQQPADLTLNKYSLEYAIEELERATDHFDPECQLGSGGFGAVYRGTQSDGTDIAVKAIDMPEEAGFEDEVRVLSKFRHPNLVILMGFARRDSQRFLVYELLEGGDVFKRLAKSSEGVPFSWRQRASAAFDAACGLSHLHNSSPKVFHRDIKSPNILLDRNGTAKMADFGLACLSHAKAHKVENAAGTLGYACPIYSTRCVVTEGSEAYSFGVVLLELLTRSPPAWILRSPDGTRKYEFLPEHVRRGAGTGGAPAHSADPAAHWPQLVADDLKELALLCTQSNDERRPRFVEIVRSLRKLRDAPEDARGPQEGRAPERLPEGVEQSPRMVEFEAQRQQAGAVQQCNLKPAGQAPAEAPKLWSLHCEFAEGADVLDALPREQRTLVHRQEPGLPLLALFKVGRQVQEGFFQAALADDATRSMVSREHFQIWATPASDDPVPDDLTPGCVPCSFFIANLSRTWTMVNGALLDAVGKYEQIRCGDRITLGRKVATSEGVRYSAILRFSFDLEGSVLCDADAPEVVKPAGVPAPLPAAAAGACRGTSLAGDVEPRFLLEVGGSGVLEQAEGARRLIAHGPPRHAGQEAAGAFAPLVLGSAHSSSFWRRLLKEQALSAMASEHVAFDAVRVQGREKGQEALQVAARNCSSAHPVLLCAGEEQGSLERARALEPGERCLLRQGDVVVIVPAKHCSVWLAFRDLAAPKHVDAALDA